MKLDYAYFSRKLDDSIHCLYYLLQLFCQRIMDGIERSEKYNKFCNYNFGNKECHKKVYFFPQQWNWTIFYNHSSTISEFLESYEKGILRSLTCLESASLKKEARSTFENIFSHFYDVRLNAPYVEIREVELHNK